MTEAQPRLYGIYNSNRKPKDLWGKNQFNSTFPVSLACYMRDNGLKAVYLSLDKNLKVKASEISFDDVFCSRLKNEELHFAFESKYPPYQDFAYDDIKGIDLVVKDTKGNFLCPLEIKLTVIPDSTTCNLSEDKWGPELVIRPATTKYCALGTIDSCKDDLSVIRNIIEPVCHNIKDWGNEFEIGAKLSGVLDAIDSVQVELLKKQKPILMQPIWKTQGKSPLLAENAFDIFIWSDFALSRLFLDHSREKVAVTEITRQKRAAARFARFMYEVSTRGKASLDRIYTEMAFSHQTDKEFAVSGRITSIYMHHPRLVRPMVNSLELKNIILGGGESKLSPERRFDQTVYFAAAQANKN
jgi:HindVP restriction endonuclease